MTMKAYYRQGKRLDKNSDIRNITPEAYICVYSRTPNMDIAVQDLIKTVGVINSFAELQNVVTGGFASAPAIVQTMIEKSLDIDSNSLANCAYKVQQRNLAQQGLGIYVRVKYEKYTEGWFSNGWNTKYSEWKQYKLGGLSGGMTFGGMAGNYESFDDAKKDIPKAMKWILKQFEQSGN